MRVRYFCIVIYVLILCFSIYMLVDAFSFGMVLKERYNDVNERVKKNVNDKQVYLEKSKRLSELKEENSGKISKYEEVVEWNEEIKQYLD